MKDLQFYNLSNYPYDEDFHTVLDVFETIFTEKDLSILERISSNNFTDKIQSGAIFFRDELKDFNPSYLSRLYKNLITNKGVFIKNTTDSMKSNYTIVTDNAYDLFKSYGNVRDLFRSIKLYKIPVTNEFKEFVEDNPPLFGSINHSDLFSQEYIYMDIYDDFDTDITKYAVNYSNVYLLTEDTTHYKYYIKSLLINDKLPHDMHYITMKNYINFLSDKKIMDINEYNYLSKMFNNPAIKDVSLHLFFNYAVDSSLSKDELFFISTFYKKYKKELTDFRNKNYKKILYTDEQWAIVQRESNFIDSLTFTIKDTESLNKMIISWVCTYNNDIVYHLLSGFYDTVISKVNQSLYTHDFNPKGIIDFAPSFNIKVLEGIKTEYLHQNKRLLEFYEYYKKVTDCPYRINLTFE